MTTPLALAEARHAQAVADLAAAEQVLHEVMISIAPIPAIGIAPSGILPRRFEVLLEGARPHRELAVAYSAYKRALRAEAKAKSAARAARLAAEAKLELKPAPKRARRRSIGGLDADEVMTGLREMRAA